MTVLVGSLPSREGRAALRAAVDECLTRGLDLTVVAARQAAEVSADELNAWESAAADARSRLSEAGRASTVVDADTEDVAQAILDTVEHEHATLVVIGLRRRTPVGKLLLGSNAQRVLLEAGCPVLAVKAAETD